MPTGQISGSQPIQPSQNSGNLKGAESEVLKLDAGSQYKEVAVSRKKGSWGSPLRAVKSVLKALPFLRGKSSGAQKAAKAQNVEKNTFQQAVTNGKVAKVKPQTYVRQPTVDAAQPLPPRNTSGSYSPKQSVDLSKLSRDDLLKIARNPNESDVFRKAAINIFSQQQTKTNPPRQTTPESPPLPPRNRSQSPESPPLPPRNKSQTPVSTPSTEQPPPLPKKRSIQGAEAKPLPKLSPRATLETAVELAKSGDNKGVEKLLNNTSDYRQVKDITQALTSRVGGKNIAAGQSGMKRMAELKHQDLVTEAKAAGYTTPDQIKAYAKTTLAKHPFFKGVAPQILANLDSLLASEAPKPLSGQKLSQPKSTEFTEAPPVPPRKGSTASTSSQVRDSQQTAGFPGGEKLAEYYGQGKNISDKEAFVRDFSAGLNLLVENNVATSDSLERAIREIERDGDPRIDPDGIFDLAERAANGEGAVATPEMVNHKHYSELRDYTRQHPVKTIASKNARYGDVKSPAATNVPLAEVNPQTGRLETARGKIHANFVPLSGRKGAIATQYPKDTAGSKADFWKMHLQQGTEVVVDLTQPGETGIKPYYPTRVGETLSLGDVSVTLVDRQGGLNNYRVVDHSTRQTGEVSRYHYQDWVDKTAISEQQLSQLASFVAGGNHTCIHCKAGIGRTMTTFVAAELLIKMRKGEILPENMDRVIDDTIKTMRKARGPNSVQTESQRGSVRNLLEYWFANGTP